MKRQLVGAHIGILVAAAFCGAIASWKPSWFVAAALFSLVAVLPLARASWKWTVPQVVGALLIAIQTSYVLCHTWFDVEYVPTFKYLRLPLLLLLPSAFALGLLPKAAKPELRSPVGLAVAYTAWVVVAGQWGLDPSRTLLLSAVMFLVVVNVGIAVALSEDTGELWGRFLKGITWLGILSCIACIVSIATGAELVRADRWISGVQRAAYRGIFFNANVMGAQGLVTVGAALAYRTLYPQRKQFWIPGILAVSGVVVLASASRACFIAYALAIAVYLFEGRGYPRLKGRTAVVLGLLLTALVAAASTDVASSALDRLAGTVSSVETGQEGRFHIWKTYFQHTWEHPIVGAGFGNSALEGNYIAMRTALRAHSPHSLLVQYLVGPGIPAGLIFGTLLFLVTKRLRNWRGDPLRSSVLMFWLILSPLFLGSTVTGPSDWGALLMWLPLILIASLPIQSRQTA